jgi:hypothetical protein
MAKPAALPPHIRQLVDKKNYVIAIKTHASEQSISMEEAKNQIDAYEMQRDAKNQTPTNSVNTNANQATPNGLNQLHQSLDNHLQQEHIKVPLIPRWVWRVTTIILVLAIIVWMGYRLFK